MVIPRLLDLEIQMVRRVKVRGDLARKRRIKMSQHNKRYVVIEQDVEEEPSVGFFTKVKVYGFLTIVSAVIGAFSGLWGWLFFFSTIVIAHFSMKD